MTNGYPVNQRYTVPKESKFKSILRINKEFTIHFYCKNYFLYFFYSKSLHSPNTDEMAINSNEQLTLHLLLATAIEMC